VPRGTCAARWTSTKGCSRRRCSSCGPSARARLGVDAELEGDLAARDDVSGGLLDSADETALRGDTLYAWLRSHDPNAIHQEARDRADAAHRARDVEVARSLRTAADAKARQLETYRELRALLDRISAELVAAEATLDELHARVMKLTLSDPGDAVAGLSVGQDLAELRKRLQVLEKSAAATLREVG
jgi:hypothetical protein